MSRKVASYLEMKKRWRVAVFLLTKMSRRVPSYLQRKNRQRVAVCLLLKMSRRVAHHIFKWKRDEEWQYVCWWSEPKGGIIFSDEKVMEWQYVCWWKWAKGWHIISSDKKRWRGAVWPESHMNPDKFSTLSLVQKNLQLQPEIYMWHLSPKDQYFPRHFPAYQWTLNVNMNRNQAFCVALAIFLLQSTSIQQQQMVAFFILYMRWINSYQAMLHIAMIWRRNRRLQRQCIAPYVWSKHLLLSVGPFVICFWFSLVFFSPRCLLPQSLNLMFLG